MTCKESIKWLENLKNELGQSQYQGLWHYEQALAETIELLKSDRLVELPCKVGDTVYLVDFEYGIYKCIVNDIQILSDNEPVYTLYFYSQNGYEVAELEWDIDIERDCFGKTVFLTKEQAEAKLKELNKE
ncbi:MAG: hypothetical protein SOY48_01635 [Eubacterium sp.]|nr:hypothetical protein [Eubacterium sp.]